METISQKPQYPARERTRVCHITSAHAPEDVRIFHKECVSLARAGYEVYLVQRGESYEKEGVRLVGFGKPSSNRLGRMLFTARRAYRTALAVDADIYHIHDPELMPYGLKLKKRGKRVIFDSHELYVEQMRIKPYLPGWSRGLVAGMYGAYERRVLRGIDGMIFPFLVDGKHPFEGQCRYVAAVDNVPRLEELYERYDESVPKREGSIVCIGSLTYSRGITHLIRAAGRTDCVLYLGGTFSPPGYQAELEAMPEYSRVRYLGQLSRAQVLETMQSCQIGMATVLNVGQYDKMGNLFTKVYEYMSMGLPVILSNTPNNVKIAEKYQFGLCVDPADPDAIAAAVQYLLDHPEEARRMGENGRRAVKEEFNWGIEEKKLLALYDEILGKTM